METNKHNQDLQRISNKKNNVFCSPGFSVFNGHHNIFIGSNVNLVDTLINAGDKEGKVTIEDYVFFGHRVMIISRSHDYNLFGRERQEHIEERPITIRTGAWIGSGSILLGGITIGKHAVVGAGSVVTRDVPEYTVVAGNPAKVIKTIDRTTGK